MRAVFFFALVCSCSCSPAEDTSPKGLVEKAARGLYATPVGTRDAERDVLRKAGTEKLQTALQATDAQCAEMLAGSAAMTAEAKADLERRCLELGPLSCGSKDTALKGVEVKSIVGDTASVVATVGAVPVELTFKIVKGAWVIDETRCP